MLSDCFTAIRSMCVPESLHDAGVPISLSWYECSFLHYSDPRFLNCVIGFLHMPSYAGVGGTNTLYFVNSRLLGCVIWLLDIHWCMLEPVTAGLKCANCVTGLLQKHWIHGFIMSFRKCQSSIIKICPIHWLGWTPIFRPCPSQSDMITRRHFHCGNVCVGPFHFVNLKTV